MTGPSIGRRQITGAALGGAIAAAIAGRSFTSNAQTGTPETGTPQAGTPAATPLAGDTRYTGGSLTADDVALLTEYAGATWGSFVEMVGATGLPSDKIERQADGTWSRVPQTSPTNIGAYLWSTVVAEELGLIDIADATARTARVVESLTALERHEGFFYNWYDVETSATLLTWPDSGDVIRPFLSSVDNAWLAAGLHLARTRYVDLAAAIDPLLTAMDFTFFYTPFDAADPVAGPGQMRGGYWPDGGGEFTGHHYGVINSETRIITYLGIALGTTPDEHYWRVFRTLAAAFEQEQTPEGPTAVYGEVVVFEGSYTYAGLRVVPSWGGSMFEALMPDMLVPEAAWGPDSWAANHPLFVEAQIRHGLDEAQYGYWGFSPASVPEGGYQEYGVDAIGQNLDGYASNTDRTNVVEGQDAPGPEAYTNGVVTPHAVFLALSYAPAAAMENLRRLAADFDIVTEYGFLDSVNVSDGAVSQSLLSLDQGMVMGQLGNVLADDLLRRTFGTAEIVDRLRPLVAQERFNVGRE